MAQQGIVLAAQPRSTLGKKVKALRRQGFTPIHLYSPGQPSRALQAPAAILRRVLQRVGKNRPVSLQVEGDQTPRLAFVREVQFHPLTSEVLHADFYGVDVARPVQVEVPVRLDGEAPAVRSLGGVLGQILHAITVECLPLEVPDAIRVDISGLDTFDKLIRVSDLMVPSHVSVLTDPGQVVVHVSPPRVEEKVEVPAAAAPAEAEAAEAEAEGEAPAEEEKKE